MRAFARLYSFSFVADFWFLRTAPRASRHHYGVIFNQLPINITIKYEDYYKLNFKVDMKYGVIWM